jgi:hypothetical protein
VRALVLAERGDQVGAMVRDGQVRLRTVRFHAQWNPAVEERVLESVKCRFESDWGHSKPRGQRRYWRGRLGRAVSRMAAADGFALM